ncbi:MAG TPA: flagellar basal-body MS-ring/collar protein FliF, partial [Anaerovoracaceae bacterium]|nr:flagellar basal-body MS-ring/collar protein FliF [Anaerovoracaceae bacterium]
MNEQISKILGPLKQFWSGATKGARSAIIIGAIVTIVIALALSIFLNMKDYVVIYDKLSATETSEILAQLQQMGVDVKLDQEGSVMVPKKDESQVRMTLATAGYPKSGLSYYMLEKGSGMLATDHERQQYENAQLQERIAASIKTLDGVKDAIVTITAPEKNVFYLQKKETPSASVIIHMQSGGVLSDSQVSGIQNLVVKSVAGLTRENVAISDSGGNDLTGNGLGSAEYTNISITREVENDIRKKVLTVLEGPYERDKLRISVAADVNTDNLFTEEKIYSPSPDGNNTGVVNQESRSDESSSTTQSDGGIPGTTSNSEVPIYPVEGGSGESTSSGSTESITYSVSEVISQLQKEGAKIESVSIGIALDKPVLEQDERDRVTRLVAYAVGIDEENIAVENFVFHSDDKPEGIFQDKEGIDKLHLY